jgi:hypothetical protein
MSSEHFIPYPDIEDPDFYETIFRKKEFHKTIFGTAYRYKTSDELCRKGEFKMQNQQEFIRAFLSPGTPYNGALLFQGTGVGKTCAAIGATEGLRDYVTKRGGKIYIISSENIKPNFYRELYDPNREKIEQNYHSVPGSYQCAGDRYYIPFYGTAEAKKQAINKLIEAHYVFMGFGKFANYVDIELGADLPDFLDQPRILKADGTPIDIGEHFSNSVFVIDEAHGIAGEDLRGKRSSDEEEEEEEQSYETAMDETDELKEDKKRVRRAISKRSLLKVLMDTVIPKVHELGQVVKIILMTATPMKDNIRELADLLQLLNLNDNRTIKVNDQQYLASDNTWRDLIFPRQINIEDLTPERLDMIKAISRGYVSYVKGNNPITFPQALLPPEKYLYEPYRINPDTGNPMPLLEYRNDEQLDVSEYFNIVLDETSGEKLQFNLVKSEMSLYQYKCYLTQLSNSKKTKRQAGADIHTRMISIMAFPHKDMNNIMSQPIGAANIKIDQLYGNTGFNAIFKTERKQYVGARGTHQYYSYAQPELGNFLDLNGDLGKYSRKLELWLRFITDEGPKGPVYSYSEFVKSGALLKAIVLEANGFLPFSSSLKNSLLKNGLPNRIRDTVKPQGPIFYPSNNDIASEDFYRCALCGQIYNNCRKNPDHEFRIATYILVTGNIGNVRDIAEAGVDNEDGGKIRVVLGTKATGQGVDFKWVRQVHIIDPWHNNTRIYQAIGRGLRHCSHADLPTDERNVTIYQYSSTPPDFFTYRDHVKDEISLNPIDLLQETVDEHMYRRVINKDLVIKKIERALKESAVDCELNRMRNYFPGQNMNYSRECDYTLCRYTCDGYSQPIRYIRRLRRYLDTMSWGIIDDDDTETEASQKKYIDENGAGKHILAHIRAREGKNIVLLNNASVWSWFEKKRYKIVNPYPDNPNIEDILVDIPLVDVDDSTYDVHFSAPQIDQAIKIISRIYQKSLALSLGRVVHLVRQADPTLEESYIYIALDKLVGSPPYVRPKTVVDKFGRIGHIIYHGGFYIYQPEEIIDNMVPLRYRGPLNIKRDHYSMETLQPKTLKAAISQIPEINMAPVKGLLERIMTVEINNVVDLIDHVHKPVDAITPAEHRFLLENLTIQIYRRDLNSEPVTIQELYLVDYYIRTGFLFVSNYDKSWGNLLDCLKNKRHLVHFMVTDKNKSRYLNPDNPNWKAETTRTDENLDKSKANIISPIAPSPPGSPQLPSHIKVYSSISDINGFIGIPRTKRTGEQIVHEGDIYNVLNSSAERLQKEYSTKERRAMAKFKYIDKEHETKAMTQAGVDSVKTKLLGAVCSSSKRPKIDVTNTKLLQELEKLGLNIPFPTPRDKVELACTYMRKALMILDYLRVNDNRWYLDSLSTETRRPIM